jgi:hypothetical protein
VKADSGHKITGYDRRYRISQVSNDVDRRNQCSAGGWRRQREQGAQDAEHRQTKPNAR